MFTSFRSRFAFLGLTLLVGSSGSYSRETEEEVFVYNVGERNWLNGDGVDAGGFLFPTLYVNLAGGAFEPGAGPEDSATSEHDPQNEGGLSALHLHLDLNLNDAVTGAVSGVGHQGPGHIWEAELEEAYLQYHLNDTVTVGGGQFLSRFGFQSDQHLHDWLFINQNLINSRMVNEGELITQGGEILVNTPSSGLLRLGFGGLRTHAHDHEHDHGGEEEEEHDEDEDHHGEHEHVHFEIDDAAFQSWVFTSDFRFRLPVDDSLVGSASIGVGENGFGRNTTIYGAGLRKVWNGHDHGYGGPDFCSGATMWQTEVIGRKVDAFLEDGDAVGFEDHGFSNSLRHGVSDRLTVSLRHDWVSAVDLAELTDRHRLSAALTAFVDPQQRVRGRIQYDYTIDETIGSEHAAWFEIQIQWGGVGGSHAGHGH